MTEKLRSRARWLVVAAALVMIPVYLLPLWSIRLVAPQYPEGMGMYIGISQISGHDEHDLQNINILNHYIGMRPIVPEEVAELEIMPWVLGGIIVLGLVAALVGTRAAVVAWLVLFMAAGAAGMVDFYLWKHDYGHNLSPDAPIKVPGMTYQPPLIGSKQLLNITASSYPHWGSGLLGIAFLLGLGAVFDGRGRRRARRETRETSPERVASGTPRPTPAG